MSIYTHDIQLGNATNYATELYTAVTSGSDHLVFDFSSVHLLQQPTNALGTGINSIPTLFADSRGVGMTGDVSFRVDHATGFAIGDEVAIEVAGGGYLSLGIVSAHAFGVVSLEDPLGVDLFATDETNGAALHADYVDGKLYRRVAASSSQTLSSLEAGTQNKFSWQLVERDNASSALTSPTYSLDLYAAGGMRGFVNYASQPPANVYKAMFRYFGHDGTTYRYITKDLSIVIDYSGLSAIELSINPQWASSYAGGVPPTYGNSGAYDVDISDANHVIYLKTDASSYGYITVTPNIATRTQYLVLRESDSDAIQDRLQATRVEETVTFATDGATTVCSITNFQNGADFYAGKHVLVRFGPDEVLAKVDASHPNNQLVLVPADGSPGPLQSAGADVVGQGVYSLDNVFKVSQTAGPIFTTSAFDDGYTPYVVTLTGKNAQSQNSFSLDLNLVIQHLGSIGSAEVYQPASSTAPGLLTIGDKHLFNTDTGHVFGDNRNSNGGSSSTSAYARVAVQDDAFTYGAQGASYNRWTIENIDVSGRVVENVSSMLDTGFRSITAFLRSGVRAGLAGNDDAEKQADPLAIANIVSWGGNTSVVLLKGLMPEGKEFVISANTSVNLGAFKQLQVSDLQVLTADNLDVAVASNNTFETKHAFSSDLRVNMLRISHLLAGAGSKGLVQFTANYGVGTKTVHMSSSFASNLAVPAVLGSTFEPTEGAGQLVQLRVDPASLSESTQQIHLGVSDTTTPDFATAQAGTTTTLFVNGSDTDKLEASRMLLFNGEARYSAVGDASVRSVSAAFSNAPDGAYKNMPAQSIDIQFLSDISTALSLPTKTALALASSYSGGDALIQAGASSLPATPCVISAVNGLMLTVNNANHGASAGQSIVIYDSSDNILATAVVASVAAGSVTLRQGAVNINNYAAFTVLADHRIVARNFFDMKFSGAGANFTINGQTFTRSFAAVYTAHGNDTAGVAEYLPSATPTAAFTSGSLATLKLARIDPAFDVTSSSYGYGAIDYTFQGQITVLDLVSGSSVNLSLTGGQMVLSFAMDVALQLGSNASHTSAITLTPAEKAHSFQTSALEKNVTSYYSQGGTAAGRSAVTWQVLEADSSVSDDFSVKAGYTYAADTTHQQTRLIPLVLTRVASSEETLSVIATIDNSNDHRLEATTSVTKSTIFLDKTINVTADLETAGNLGVNKTRISDAAHVSGNLSGVPLSAGNYPSNSYKMLTLAAGASDKANFYTGCFILIGGVYYEILPVLDLPQGTTRKIVINAGANAIENGDPYTIVMDDVRVFGSTASGADLKLFTYLVHNSAQSTNMSSTISVAESSNLRVAGQDFVPGTSATLFQPYADEQHPQNVVAASRTGQSQLYIQINSDFSRDIVGHRVQISKAGDSFSFFVASYDSNNKALISSEKFADDGDAGNFLAAANTYTITLLAPRAFYAVPKASALATGDNFLVKSTEVTATFSTPTTASSATLETYNAATQSFDTSLSAFSSNMPAEQVVQFRGKDTTAPLELRMLQFTALRSGQTSLTSQVVTDSNVLQVTSNTFEEEILAADINSAQSRAVLLLKVTDNSGNATLDGLDKNAQENITLRLASGNYTNVDILEALAFKISDNNPVGGAVTLSEPYKLHFDTHVTGYKIASPAISEGYGVIALQIKFLEGGALLTIPENAGFSTVSVASQIASLTDAGANATALVTSTVQNSAYITADQTFRLVAPLSYNLSARGMYPQKIADGLTSLVNAAHPAASASSSYHATTQANTAASQHYLVGQLSMANSFSIVTGGDAPYGLVSTDENETVENGSFTAGGEDILILTRQGSSNNITGAPNQDYINSATTPADKFDSFSLNSNYNTSSMARPTLATFSVQASDATGNALASQIMRMYLYSNMSAIFDADTAFSGTASIFDIRHSIGNQKNVRTQIAGGPTRLMQNGAAVTGSISLSDTGLSLAPGPSNMHLYYVQEDAALSAASPSRTVALNQNASDYLTSNTIDYALNAGSSATYDGASISGLYPNVITYMYSELRLGDTEGVADLSADALTSPGFLFKGVKGTGLTVNNIATVSSYNRAALVGYDGTAMVLHKSLSVKNTVSPVTEWSGTHDTGDVNGQTLEQIAANFTAMGPFSNGMKFYIEHGFYPYIKNLANAGFRTNLLNYYSAAQLEELHLPAVAAAGRYASGASCSVTHTVSDKASPGASYEQVANFPLCKFTLVDAGDQTTQLVHRSASYSASMTAVDDARVQVALTFTDGLGAPANDSLRGQNMVIYEADGSDVFHVFLVTDNTATQATVVAPAGGAKRSFLNTTAAALVEFQPSASAYDAATGKFFIEMSFTTNLVLYANQTNGLSSYVKIEISVKDRLNSPTTIVRTNTMILSNAENEWSFPDSFNPAVQIMSNVPAYTTSLTDSTGLKSVDTTTYKTLNSTQNRFFMGASGNNYGFPGQASNTINLAQNFEQIVGILAWTGSNAEFSSLFTTMQSVIRRFGGFGNGRVRDLNANETLSEAAVRLGIDVSGFSGNEITCLDNLKTTDDITWDFSTNTPRLVGSATGPVYITGTNAAQNKLVFNAGQSTVTDFLSVGMRLKVESGNSFVDLATITAIDANAGEITTTAWQTGIDASTQIYSQDFKLNSSGVSLSFTPSTFQVAVKQLKVTDGKEQVDDFNSFAVPDPVPYPTTYSWTGYNWVTNATFNVDAANPQLITSASNATHQANFESKSYAGPFSNTNGYDVVDENGVVYGTVFNNPTVPAIGQSGFWSFQAFVTRQIPSLTRLFFQHPDVTSAQAARERRMTYIGYQLPIAVGNAGGSMFRMIVASTGVIKETKPLMIDAANSFPDRLVFDKDIQLELAAGATSQRTFDVSIQRQLITGNAASFSGVGNWETVSQPNLSTTGVQFSVLSGSVLTADLTDMRDANNNPVQNAANFKWADTYLTGASQGATVVGLPGRRNGIAAFNTAGITDTTKVYRYRLAIKNTNGPSLTGTSTFPRQIVYSAPNDYMQTLGTTVTGSGRSALKDATEEVTTIPPTPYHKVNGIVVENTSARPVTVVQQVNFAGTKQITAALTSLDGTHAASASLASIDPLIPKTSASISSL